MPMKRNVTVNGIKYLCLLERGQGTKWTGTCPSVPGVRVEVDHFDKIDDALAQSIHRNRLPDVTPDVTPDATPGDTREAPETLNGPETTQEDAQGDQGDQDDVAGSEDSEAQATAQEVPAAFRRTPKRKMKKRKKQHDPDDPDNPSVIDPVETE